MKFSDVLLQHGRAMEWMTSAILLSYALTLAMPGDTFGPTTAWAGFARMGLSEVNVAVPVAILSVLRMAALVINGMWRRSPVLRMIGASLGAFCFGVITSAAAYPYFSGLSSVVSTGFGVYLLLTIADIIATYRAGADVGNYGGTH